jgi:dinuclear metal center YbgI/SA1388 family protein
MCCPDGQKEVHRALVTLDVTAHAVQKAIDGNYDVIVSHHPFIFKGLKAIDTEGGGVDAKAVALIKSGISVMSFHTRLDAVEGGVNDTLCALLGIADTQPIYEEGIPLGRIGRLESPLMATELARRVKQILCAPFVLLSGEDGTSIEQVAVLGGSGKDVIESARAAGAQAFVSGRLDYHPLTDEGDRARGMALIEAGHYFTEQPVCGSLCGMIGHIDSGIRCDIFESNIIKAI